MKTRYMTLWAVLTLALCSMLCTGCGTAKSSLPVLMETDYYITTPGAVVTNPCPTGVRRYHTFSDRALELLIMPHREIDATED